MFEDKEATILLKLKNRFFKFFYSDEIIFKPHFYKENWGNYYFIEFQWLKFLFVYERDS